MALFRQRGILNINSATAASGPLTADDFFNAVKAIEDQEPHPCRRGQHLVSPDAQKRGYGICVECGQRVGEWPDA